MKYIILLALLFSCSKDSLYPSPFSGRLDGSFTISMQTTRDNNGFFHYRFNRNKDFDYTNVFVEAIPVTNERYIYNGTSVIEGKFDSNGFWIMGDSLSVTLPLYNPFNSLYSSPSFTSPLPVGTKTVILSQFKDQIVPIVPSSPIYFKKYDSRMDEYKPIGNNLWSKRIIGPIPKGFIGDTIKVYGKVSWECGNYSIQYPDRTRKIDSINVIIE